MISRKLTATVRKRLNQFPAVTLLGPRQVGKTTLAKSLGKETDSIYLDLENPEDLEKLSDAREYLLHHRGKLIILDEVQRLPNLFQILRGLIDEGIELGFTTGQFLLLGSASIELLKQSSESLAGRIAYLELTPLEVAEIDPASINELWIRGGFPRSFLAADEEQSVTWRNNFIQTYLERDIPQLGPRIPAETLRRFWTMLAHLQGSPLNAANLAKSLSVDGKTVARYLDLMVDLLLIRRLQPYHANVGKRLVKSPKVYLRDSGLLHTLLRLDDYDEILSHPITGESWEGFVIESLIRAAPDRAEVSYYRTSAGAEIDLLLDLGGKHGVWAIEIKRSLAPKVTKGFHISVDDIKPSKAFVVYTGLERYPKGGGVEAIGLVELCGLLYEL
ncbi:ATP-binding protein [Leucothrix pacifica]|uniref:ATPase n=1 Tax=Leucothrix pacifica TaxID=1247513 RepID=A0A317CNG7_9GAMM|nr:ATP-binding protein [Leucothrix pacifica]PWQ99869.1 ATPase [Leucothrix pacifica]